jgi:hypothetical protein
MFGHDGRRAGGVVVLLGLPLVCSMAMGDHAPTHGEGSVARMVRYPTLHLSKNLSLPVEVVTPTFAILAKRGAGKTYTAAVLDLSQFRKGEQMRFMTDVAERLYHKNRQPLHLVLDVAGAFAPQRPMRGQERLLGAIEDEVWQRFASKWATLSLQPRSFNYLRLVSAEHCTQRVS